MAPKTVTKQPSILATVAKDDTRIEKIPTSIPGVYRIRRTQQSGADPIAQDLRRIIRQEQQQSDDTP